jgi:hypothetical protein
MTRAGSPPPPEDSDSDLPSGSRPELRSLFHTRHAGLRAELGALQRAVDLPTTVLIFGESGTGKDRLARALHDASARAPLSFVRIDAANLSDDLFESELFGHERGAFTGAVAVKRGLLEVAGEGTAYLDEVSSLSPAAQAKFLRVLQERTFRRLGGTATHAFRARLIVSSRRDLAELVARGAFRDDFFYRIDVVSVRLPSLAERSADILPLAREFLRKAAREHGSPARRFAPEAEETPSVAGQRARAGQRGRARRDRGPRPRRGVGGSSGGSTRLAGVAVARGGGAPLDAARAGGRVHRGDPATLRRQPDPRGQAARNLPEDALAAPEEEAGVSGG